eukprot:COSAG02_NODE_7908_length_2795_cov_2.120920_1_plen_171_part_00
MQRNCLSVRLTGLRTRSSKITQIAGDSGEYELVSERGASLFNETATCTVTAVGWRGEWAGWLAGRLRLRCVSCYVSLCTNRTEGQRGRGAEGQRGRGAEGQTYGQRGCLRLKTVRDAQTERQSKETVTGKQTQTDSRDTHTERGTLRQGETEREREREREQERDRTTTTR